MSRLRVAVIGTGRWAYQHLRAFTAREDVEVVGVYGRSEERTRRRAERFGVAPYTDLDALLDHARPELVSLCLPNQAHFEPALRVLQAGVALVVDKPLVFDLDEADTLLAEARRRELFFAVVFNHRYARPMMMAQDAVRSGHIGDLVLATWRFGGEGPADHPYNNLIETQCHGFDALEQLAGPIQSLAAQLCDRTRPGAYTTMSIALRFRSGAVGSLVGSYDDSYSHSGVHVLELVGSAGRVLVEDTVRRFSLSRHGSETTEVWQAGYFADPDRQFLLTLDACLADLVAAFRAGAPPPVPAEAGRRALQLAHAAIESHRTGRRVDV